MSTPRYIAKRVGNDYKFVRADAQGVVLSGLATVGGGLLMLHGLRGGLVNKMLGLAGGGLLYYGLTGNNPIEAIQQYMGSQSPDGEEHGPSFQHDAHTNANQKPQDQIDEASMESFPASDAPAHFRSTAAT